MRTFFVSVGIFLLLIFNGNSFLIAQESTKLVQIVDNNQSEGLRIQREGEKLEQDNQFNPAIEKYQQALKIFQRSKNWQQQGNVLHKISYVYIQINHYERSIYYGKMAVFAYQMIEDQKNEAIVLNNIGLSYHSLKEYQKATDFYIRALDIHRKLDDKKGERRVYYNFAQLWQAQHKFLLAFLTYEKIVAIDLNLKNLDDAIKILEVIKKICPKSQEVRKCDEISQQLEQVKSEEKNRKQISDLEILALQARVMQRAQVGLVALETALNLSQKINDHEEQAEIMNQLGGLYFDVRQYKKSIQVLQSALVLAKRTDKVSLKTFILRNLGKNYQALHQYAQAENYLHLSLRFAENLDDKQNEKLNALDALAELYLDQHRYKKALEIYHQILFINHKIDDSPDADTFSGIGFILANYNQRLLAIAFLKKAVYEYEDSRRFYRKSSYPILNTADRWYVLKVARTYEKLAALLFQENRIAEALQVLDLLKVQDLQDFLKDLKGNELPTQGISLLPQETTILQDFEQQKPRSLDQWLTQPNLQTLIQQIKTTAPTAGLQSPGYKALQTRLTQLSPNSALFYPLILPDRLELVILTPGKPPIHQTVRNLPKAELEQAIDTFSNQLGQATPSGNPIYDLPTTRTTAQKLYDHLIRPIAAELKAANITTLLYAPDGKLRYIPLAALHDGQNWLIQTYTINHLTALSLTPTTKATTSQPKALVGAVTQGSKVQVAGQSYEYAPLNNTKVEATAIGKLFNTQPLIDQDLTRQNLQANLPSINIFHLASHAEFNPQSPELSFILLGNNQTLTLRDLKDLKLPNINLFVLSACETAKGVNKDGIELFGFGYQLQRNQVRAAIASLWKVSDGSTSQLMQSFYHNLNTGKISPVEALQRAQREALRDPTWNQLPNGQKLLAHMGDDPNDPILPSIRRGDPTHPYYWAPFILIGNGL